LPNYSTVWAGEGLHVSAFLIHLSFKFQGSVTTVVKKRIYIFLYFEIYGATGGGAKYFRRGPYISVHYRKVSPRGPYISEKLVPGGQI